MIRSICTVNMAAERVYAWYWRRRRAYIVVPENP